MGEDSRIFKFQKFTTAIALAEALAPNAPFRLIRIELNVDDTPTDSEDLTVTLDAGDGSAYDTVLYTRDLSVGSVTDLVIPFGEGYEFESDDEIDLAYDNTGRDTISGRYVYELI